MPATKLNIYQKLIKVRKSCAGLQKKNEGFQYKYVSSSDTLKALRGAMDEQQLLLIPEVLSHEIREYETIKEVSGKADKKGMSYFTDLTIQYTWIDTEDPAGDKVVCQWCAQGVDTGEKGVGKALTYGEKYFLLKFFNIPTDKDDPDANQPEEPQEPSNITARRKAQPPKQQSSSQSSGGSTTKQGSAIHAICQTKYNMLKAGVYPFISRAIRTDRELASTSELTFEQASTIISMLNDEPVAIKEILAELREKDNVKQNDEQSKVAEELFREPAHENK